MLTAEFKIGFRNRAAIELADNEKVAIWEPTRAGTLRVKNNAVQLDGKWKVSAIGSFLGSGLLGELLIKPFFLNDRSETIPVQNIERAVVHQKKKNICFHLFQTRDKGMVEVHVFQLAQKEAVPEVWELLKALVPPNLFEEKLAG